MKNTLQARLMRSLLVFNLRHLFVSEQTWQERMSKLMEKCINRITSITS